jgi:hypothetical protein
MFTREQQVILSPSTTEVTMALTWDVFNGQIRVASVQAFSAADAITYVEQQIGGHLINPIAIPLDGE